MPKAHNPRHGSMQVWPRKRAKRMYPRVRTYPSAQGVLGFAGYKAGMTHVIATDAGKNSMTKGEDISIPVTVIECPPLRIFGVRFYKKGYQGKEALVDVLAKPSKDLSRKLSVPKKELKTLDSVKVDDYVDIVLLVQTQPRLTGIGKKKPDVFELAVGGSLEEKLAFAKENLGKEISVKDVLKEGQFIDIHAVTKGKGFQGPVKRFGIKVRAQKAEKTKRGPGSLGGWISQGHVMYRIAHAGQMGFHNRVDYNKQVLLVGDDPEKVNPEGGFIRYGLVKNQYLLLKGSVPGPKKRLIRMNLAIRPDKRKEEIAPTVQTIITASKQKR